MEIAKPLSWNSLGNLQEGNDAGEHWICPPGHRRPQVDLADPDIALDAKPPNATGAEERRGGGRKGNGGEKARGRTERALLPPSSLLARPSAGSSSGGRGRDRVDGGVLAGGYGSCPMLTMWGQVVSPLYYVMLSLEKEIHILFACFPL